MPNFFFEVTMNHPFAFRRRPGRAGLVAGLLIFLATLPSGAQSLTDFEKRVTVRTLSNGWTFIICERPVAPVFTFATHANVGSAQEVPGITGLAHMFEHMAFKGTPNIGTTDYAAEKKVLDKVDQAYAAYDAERRRLHPDAAKVKASEKAWKDAQEEADKLIVKNEFGEFMDRQGGAGFTAGTRASATASFSSLPRTRRQASANLQMDRMLY